MTATSLQRHLRLPDLVLAQILIVVGTNWFGAAATLGLLGVLFWPLALLLYHGPLALVVMALIRACPEEAGPYQWIKLGYGARPAVFFGWTLCAFMMVFIAAGCMGVATGLGYALQGFGLMVLEQPLYARGMPFVILLLLAVVGLLGFQRGKWVQNLAAAALLLVIFLLGYRVLQSWLLGQWPSLGLSLPTDPGAWFSLLKITVFALSGLEFLALVAGECEQPERQLPRSIRIAAPINILIYMLGTLAVVVTIPRSGIDLVNPAAQVLGSLGGLVAGLVLWALLLRDFGQSSLGLAGVSRLPMQVGLDGLLPRWFSQLNAQGVPVRAILLSSAIVAALLAFVLFAAERQDAFQMLLSAAGILFGLTYVLMFSLPLLASNRLALAATPLLRAAALIGGSLALGFVLISVYPIGEQAEPLRHVWRVLVIIAVLLLPGLVLALRFRART